MFSSQFKHLTKNSALLAFQRHSQWGVVLYSFGNPMSFCNPLERKIYSASTEFRTTKVHQAGWLKSIIQSASVPGVESFETLPATVEQIEQLWNDFLRLPELPAATTDGNA